MKKWTTLLTLVLAVALLATGCATKKYVDESVQTGTQPINARIDDVEGQVEETQTRLDQQGNELRGEIGEVSKTAQEALERAEKAGKLAEGKFLYEAVLTDDDVRFGFESSELSDEAKAALDDFAAKVKADNRDVYVEIQGHTDSTGSESYNEKLGLGRASAVHRYLSQAHDFPLHRMNVISYGETEPIADNSSREGRAQNRRVTLVVLQ